MLKIILDFWPALIPVMLYSIWLLWAKRRIKQGGNPLKWTNTPWIYAAMLTMLGVLICFGVLIYGSTSEKGKIYIPAQYKDGKLIPSKME